MRLLLFLLGTSFVCATSATCTVTKESLETVVDLARGASPELAADALIRVAERTELPSGRRIELLEQAFRLATVSSHPYRRRSALGSARGPAGYADRAYSLEIDTLSLQARAVEGLLSLDPRKARQRFEDISAIQLPSVTCEEFLVYDVHRFYEVLGEVAASSFTAKEAKEGEPVKFLARYIGVISSPAQVGPVARLLTTAPVADAGFQVLTTAFASALTRIAGDDRSFTFAAEDTGESIRVLAELSRQRQLSPAVVIGAYRSFLVNHLGGKRCEESVSSGNSTQPVDYFNERLHIAAVPLLGETETIASKVEGKAQGLASCESPECRGIREQYRTLVSKGNEGAVQEGDRAQFDWQTRARDFLSSLAAWQQSSGAAPVDYFREKVQAYNDLLAVVPVGDTRDFVLRSLSEFLLQNRLPAENQLDWYLPVTQLAGRIGMDPGAFGRAAEDVRRANDSVIALEMALESVAPRPTNAFMLLL